MTTVEQALRRRDEKAAAAKENLRLAAEWLDSDDIGLALEEARQAVRELERAEDSQRQIDNGMEG